MWAGEDCAGAASVEVDEGLAVAGVELDFSCVGFGYYSDLEGYSVGGAETGVD